MEKRPRSRRNATKAERVQADFLFYEDYFAGLGYKWIAGVDEAGRGPLAGPVVAAAVILGDWTHPLIFDSKQVSASGREFLYTQILAHSAAVSTARVEAGEIDRINIYQASRLAMLRALVGLPCQPNLVLVDAMRLDTSLAQCGPVRADSRLRPVAAASIVAKVTRDRIMQEYHACYPQYGFDRHKGYPTARHREMLSLHGPCPLHRTSFCLTGSDHAHS